jgi:hypothetical protein
MFLDQRLKDANEPPGLRATIVERVAMQMDVIEQRGQSQLNHLRSASSQRLPEAYLIDEEILENELQRGAAGIRAARALEGGVFSNPTQFEHALAQRLTPTAQWALRGEASRVPRPPNRPPALDWSLDPIPWLNNDNDEWPPARAIPLAGVTQVEKRESYLVRLAEVPYSGWIQLGLVEQQKTLPQRYPEVPGRRLFIGAGLEALDTPAPPNSSPFSAGRPDWWAGGHDETAPQIDAHRAESTLNSAQIPLCAIVDYAGQQGAPKFHRGTGLHPYSLVPQIEIIAALGLRPERPALRYVLIDDDGPGIVGRTWHGFLIHSGDYRPLVPAVHGADLLIRPDLYDRLESVVGADRLTMRVVVDFSEEDVEDD